ncbi:helix-hairpin-helix domain-containing protein [Parasphingorhabdus pacifica]
MVDLSAAPANAARSTAPMTAAAASGTAGSGTAASGTVDERADPTPSSAAADPRARLRALMTHRDEEDDVEAATRPTRSREWMSELAARWLPARWLPESLRHARFDPGRAGLLGLSLLAVLGLLVVAATTWVEQPEAESAPPPPPSIVAAPSTSAPPAEIVVSVVGQVARPGLISLDEGARVADALESVGGALPGTDVTTINLARELVDGEQLHVAVPVPPGVEVPEDPAAPGESPAGSGRRIDLNTATEEDLHELPGVGEVTAERIVNWRTENGSFTSVDELREVAGIGEVRLSRLRDLVRV